MTYNLLRTFFSLEKRRKYKRNYYKQIEVKRKRIQKLQDKLREGEKMMRKHRKKEETYKSGMAYNVDVEMNEEKMKVLLKSTKKKLVQKRTINRVAHVEFLATYAKVV